MSSNKSGRVLVAAALAAALFLAVPAQAMEARGALLGPLERLAAWFVEAWALDGLAGGDATTRTDSPDDTETTLPTDDDDPEGCRGDYTACIDPNG